MESKKNWYQPLGQKIKNLYYIFGQLKEKGKNMADLFYCSFMIYYVQIIQGMNFFQVGLRHYKRLDLLFINSPYTKKNSEIKKGDEYFYNKKLYYEHFSDLLARNLPLSFYFYNENHQKF